MTQKKIKGIVFNYKRGDRIMLKEFTRKSADIAFIIEVTSVGDNLFLGREVGHKTEYSFRKSDQYCYAPIEMIEKCLNKLKIPTHKTTRKEWNSDGSTL